MGSMPNSEPAIMMVFLKIRFFDQIVGWAGVERGPALLANGYFLKVLKHKSSEWLVCASMVFRAAAMSRAAS